MCQVFSFCVVANSCVVEVSGFVFYRLKLLTCFTRDAYHAKFFAALVFKDVGAVYATRLYKRVGSGAAAYKQHLVGQ